MYSQPGSFTCKSKPLYLNYRKCGNKSYAILNNKTRFALLIIFACLFVCLFNYIYLFILQHQARISASPSALVDNGKQVFKLGFTEGFPMGNTVAGTMKLFNNTFVYLTPVNCSCVGLLQEKQWVLKLYYTKVLKRRRKVSNLNILKYQINYINWGYTRKTLMGRLRGRGFKKKSARKKKQRNLLSRALIIYIIISECEHDRYITLNKTYKISTSYLELKAFTVLGDIIRFILIV